MELAIAAVTGLLCGHAIDLAWGRFYTGEKITGPIYRCAACRSPVSPPFLLPFATLRWRRLKCPDCGHGFPLRSLVLPTGSALLFAVSYLRMDRELGAGLLAGFFTTIFLTLTLTDLEKRLLPNRIIYPATILAIALSWGWPGTSITEILIGGGVAILIAALLLLLSLPFGGEAFGMGDVKMIILIGFVVGIPSVLVAIAVGTFAAGVVAALLILTGLRGRKDYIPHGPFLAFGAVVALWWGQPIWEAYLR